MPPSRSTVEIACFHEHGLIENDAGLQLRRNVAQSLDRFLDSVDHRDGVGVSALLLNRDIDGFLAVHADDVVLQAEPSTALPTSETKHRFLAFGLQRNVVQSMLALGTWALV